MTDPETRLREGDRRPAHVCAMSTPEHSLRYPGWRVVAASSVAAFFASSFIVTFSVFLRPLTEEFGWSRQAVSAAFSSMALTIGAMAPLVGYLVDRGSPRVVFASGAVMSALAFASNARLTPPLWHLYVAFVLLGIGNAATSPVVYSRLIVSWFEQRRGLALAIVISSAGLCSILYPPLAFGLIQVVGWRFTYLIMGLATMTISAPMIVTFVRDPPSLLSRAGHGVSGWSVGAALRTRTFLSLVAGVIGSTIVFNGALVHLAPLLTDRGIPANRAVAVVSTMGAAGVAGRLLTGWSLDRFAATQVSAVLLSSAALGTFLLSGASSFAVALGAAILMGIGTGGEFDVTPYLLARYFGLRSLATLYGVAWLAFALGGALSPVLMGRAFDATGSYEWILASFSVVTLAAALLMLTLPPPASSGHAP